MSILITGASGHLGSLITAGLISKTPSNLVVPIREHHSHDAILKSFEKIFKYEGGIDENFPVGRLTFLHMPSLGNVRELRPVLKELEVREIIHCAGSLDYYDKYLLEKTNIGLTKELLDLGRALGIKRFIFISTAFSSGFSDKLIPETLHEEPASDPTFYTYTKRQAERLVAQSGLPYLILRPSVVIGDSRNGRYDGKNYGLYQFTSVFEKIFCKRYLPVVHLVAPNTPQNFLHQDSFYQGFLAAYQFLPEGSILHLVSDPKTSPTIRDFYNIWMEICYHPSEVHYYNTRGEMTDPAIDQRLKVLAEITKVNTEISSHPWNFETRNLQWLRDMGCKFVDTSLKSLRLSMEEVIAKSRSIQNFISGHRHLFSSEIKFFQTTTEGFMSYLGSLHSRSF